MDQKDEFYSKRRMRSMGAGRRESQAATHYQHNLGQGISLSLKFLIPPRIETLDGKPV